MFKYMLIPVQSAMRIIKMMTIASASGTIAYSSWLAFRPLTNEEKANWNAIYMEDSSIRLRVYRRLPLNALSRLWGRCQHVELPEFARQPAYSLYARLFHCNLTEVANSDLTGYRNLSEFFRRELRPDARPVAAKVGLVAPADGLVLHLGRAEPDGRLEQVKGVDYTLQSFLGPLSSDNSNPRLPDSEYYSRLKTHSSGSSLYHCVIYLSPGDYHRFHSPTDWQASRRRHYPGYLMSVSPGVAGLVRGLFCLNERAVFTGSWRHGFFAYAAVGATNVGNIRVYADQDLVTNAGGPLAPYRDLDLQSKQGGLRLSKGELFGEFDLGSTIVLVFEAPDNFEFKVHPGQRVRVGEALSNL
uniref:Phosphatidylserine decarboxylase proenzyme, mitochondrial n=2 Tax=Macrostomum lignano TaxID=282301 RepID=A0A1I8IG16_9PLAT